MAFEEELPDATTWEDAHKGKRKYKVLASIADFMEGGKQLGFFPGRKNEARAVARAVEARGVLSGAASAAS